MKIAQSLTSPLEGEVERRSRSGGGSFSRDSSLPLTPLPTLPLKGGGLIAFAALLALAACATPDDPAASGPTPAQSVMKAQFEAPAPAGGAPPMSGAEADAIHKHYLEGIGKPLPQRNSETTGTTQ